MGKVNLVGKKKDEAKAKGTIRKRREAVEDQVKTLLYNADILELYLPDMSLKDAEELSGRSQGDIWGCSTKASLVIYYLRGFSCKDHPKGFIDLYVRGMTIEMAETAVKNHPGYPGYRSPLSEQMRSKYNL